MNAALRRTINPVRVWNYFLLRSSYSLSAILGRPIHWGKPLAVSIEPTTACNLGCPQCPSGLKKFTRPTGNLKTDLNKKILDQLGPTLQYINYYFQGEPFIHRNFLELVREASKRNIYVVTSTNAHFISPETAREIVDSGLSEAIISIDGMSQESYEKYRIGGELNKVLEGAKNLIAAKREKRSVLPKVTFQFLVTRYNENEIPALNELALSLGVDEVRLKTIQIYDHEGGNLIPENESYSRYQRTDAGRFELKNKFRNSCWRMWSSCVFTWDGKVVPCCFDKDAEHQMGEVEKLPFGKIWKSDVYRGFRKQLLRNRREIEICRNCSEGSKIWV